jgi:hypothetical protein
VAAERARQRLAVLARSWDSGMTSFERTIEWVRTTTLARILGGEPGACAVDGVIQVCAGEWRAEDGGWRFWRDPAFEDESSDTPISEKGKAEALREPFVTTYDNEPDDRSDGTP